MKDAQFAKLVVLINGLIPLGVIGLDAWRGQLGANPLAFFTTTTGLLTLIFLTLSLAVTPLRKITGINFLSHFRKMLGLFAFFYGLLHLLAFAWFDHFFNPLEIVKDTIQRPFVTFGMLAFFLMVPLAMTSTNRAIKRMGAARWKRLHQLVYVAAVAGIVHYWLLKKVIDRLPLTFAGVMAALLLFRVYDALRVRARLNAAATARAPLPPPQE
jgi:sulfoxide reductase heme-binding subunit YedZ